jgi:hypothetical protein
MNNHNYTQQLTAQNSVNPPRCECHECTQARWKTSLQGQIQGSLGKQLQQNQTNS